MSGIDVVESRIAALQNAINALANGAPAVTAAAGSSSASSFSDVLLAQSADLSTTMDAAGGANLSPDDLSGTLGQYATTGTTDGLSIATSAGPTGSDVVAD